MQISKSSWHYRFTDTFVGSFADRCRRGQHTTCSYIRAVFYAICSCLLFVAFFGFIGSAALAIVTSMLAAPILIFFFEAIKVPEVMLMAATVGWIAVAIVLFTYTVNHILKYTSEYSAKRRSLVIQAMQDKKEGICTIVRIQD